MKCARIVPLLERFVDGKLEPVMMRRIAEHAQSCTRCSARIRSARSLVAAFAAAPVVSAPDGFFQRVMDRVYRQAPATPSAPVAGARSAGSAAAASARFYRRLGLSLVLTAGVLGASLLIPGAAYTTLVGSAGGAKSTGVGVPRGSAIVVKSALDGAGITVRDILGESRRTR